MSSRVSKQKINQSELVFELIVSWERAFYFRGNKKTLRIVFIQKRCSK